MPFAMLPPVKGRPELPEGVLAEPNGAIVEDDPGTEETPGEPIKSTTFGIDGDETC